MPEVLTVSELSAIGYALLAAPVIALVVVVVAVVLMAGARAALALINGEAARGGPFGQRIAVSLIILALTTLGIILIALGEPT
jgi:hypothetical protein